MAKTWQQKLHTGKPAKVEVLAKPFAGALPGARMYIATPELVQDYVKTIPCGQACTIAEMRAAMAAANGADLTCPLTSGIFARIVAEVALEQLAAGAKPDQVAPFWRLIEPGSALGKKLSCGVDTLRALRQAEGLD